MSGDGSEGGHSGRGRDGARGGLVLTGEGLTTTALTRAARDFSVRIDVLPSALARIAERRKPIDEAVAKYAAAHPNVGTDDLIYGITSGFGEFKTVAIPPGELIDLQRNLLLSHAAGVGDTADWLDAGNYFAAEVVRAAMIVRLNAFLRGNSGVRKELVLTLRAMINAGVVPLVPTKGSLGSSGDLCPLAHLFSVLLGEGHFYLAARHAAGAGVLLDASNGRISWMIGGTPVTLLPARELWLQLRAAGAEAGWGADDLAALDACERVPVSNKEALALSNGATFSAALLALAVHDAEGLARAADAGAALTMEAVCARVRFLDPEVHRVRGMAGQEASAANIRGLIEGTRLCEWAEPVQDAYSVRCAPQVHGASRDAIAYARHVATAEINASTDNPLFFPGHEAIDLAIRRSRPEQAGTTVDTTAYSAGNFHGQPVALACDFLAIAVAELANISERRTQMLLDATHNRNLPPNLVAKPGVDSGFMIAQYTAASLVSENKVLCHPASVDSIPTSANFEDHVAMATHAARKARQVVENATAVVAIELLVAAQAADWRTCRLDDDAGLVEMDRKNYYAIDPNERHANEKDLNAARAMARAEHRLARFRSAKPKGASARTIASLGRGTGAVYRAVRERVDPLHRDKPLAGMIREIREMVSEMGEGG